MPDVSFGDHWGESTVLEPYKAPVDPLLPEFGLIMAPILTAEDVVRRIAAECAYVDERGGVGIRLEPAAAIVRQYAAQFRRGTARKPRRQTNKPAPLL